MNDLWTGVEYFFHNPPVEEWLRLLYVTAGLFVFIGLAELARYLTRWSSEVTRKSVHISVGMLIFFAPSIFTHPLPAIVLALFFIVSNYASIKLGLFKAMHAMERESYGTVYYPLSFLILVIMMWKTDPMIISASMLVLALGDAGAAIVGTSIRKPIYYNLSGDKKSIQGSLAMFFITWMSVSGVLVFYRDTLMLPMPDILIIGFISAATATAWEGIASKGFDNLTVPLSVAFMMLVLLHTPEDNVLPQMLVGTLLAMAIVVVSIQLKFLQISGGVATFLLATYIYGLGGWKWTIPILMFFILSSILSKIGRRMKSELLDEALKTHTRDYQQVLANGGVAGIVAMLQYFFPEKDLYPVYLGSVAAVTADTWASEIGMLIKGTTRSIIDFKIVSPGSNGGVSVAGFIASFIGAAVIAGSGLVQEWNWVFFLIVVTAGVIGTLVDSVLGATIQGHYYSEQRFKVTEKPFDWDHTTGERIPNKFMHGWKLITNDTVNFFCAFTGGITVALVLLT